ncbi:MAG TPA: IclR family transcriptional regulator [Anaerolineaceae bacterium]|nr:IclR family transcriptional regulator [Anaerolineaceae bacterium]
MDTSAVKTIDRFVEILDFFAQGHEAVSLTELSDHLNLPKSTLHRFLTGLESHGIVRRDPNDKKWRLGYHLFVWGLAAAESTTLREVAKPFMTELVVTSGETVILTVYQDHEVLCIDMIETSHTLRLKMEIGAQRAAHAGASSKVLIAYLSDDEVMAIVKEKGLPKLCTNTITDVNELKAELARIRALGYADSLEETDPGAWGVATPIRDWKGQVVGAIGLAGPTMRYSSEKIKQYATLCAEYAEKISAALGAKFRQENRSANLNSVEVVKSYE